MLTTITGGGSFTRQNISDINQNFQSLLGGITPGNVIYCNPASSYVGTQTGSQDAPYTDLAVAYSATRNGMNDVVVLVGNGATNGSARLNATLTWSNNATHLIGLCAAGPFFQRARIAPLAGATAFANFVVISGSGCQFQNVMFYQEFGTGTSNEICVTVTGERNAFYNCQFAGIIDATALADTGARSLKIGSAGKGENYFSNCVIGTDTATRSAANASLESAGATPRNVFDNCIFPFMGSAAGVLGIVGTGAGCVDRETYFRSCVFSNAIKSSSTTMDVLASFSSASPGGYLLFKGCMMVGITDFGNANGLANSYVDMPQPSATAGGIGVNPS